MARILRRSFEAVGALCLLIGLALPAGAADDHACRLWGVIGHAPDPATLQDQLVTGTNPFVKLAETNDDGWGVAYFAVPGSTDRAREYGLRPPYGVAAYDPLLPAFLLRVPHRERAYIAGELASVDRRRAMEFVLGVDPALTGRSVVEAPVPETYRPPRAE